MVSKRLILIQCPDKVGIVAHISNILADYQQNIISMREFVEEETKHFFSRIECEGEKIDHQKFLEECKKKLDSRAKVQIVLADALQKVVVLVTKEFHCLQDILVENYFGLLGAEVSAVIGNHKKLENFTERFSIPFYHIPRKDKTKQQFENDVLDVIEKHKPDYLILAKFMQILSGTFVDKFSNRIINIHHSFLPAFIGANPYKQAFKRGVKIIGATAHFVTEDLDNGPIITQETKQVNHNYNSEMMRDAGKEIERNVLSKALHLVFDHRVFVTRNKTVVFD